jgi:F420-dependent oxidoreductase-like protein
MDLRIFTEPHQGASYDDILAAAQKTEECGYDAFFRSDHYLRMTPGDPLPGPTDAWITLAGLARETGRIRLGTLVSPATFRLPSALAISVAQVDAMSGGRIELGLGTGWFEAEHRAYGIPFPGVHERFDVFEEQLEIVTGLWSTPVGEKFSFAGRHYTLSDSPALPKPLQDPVPLIVGGGGRRRTPALAARFATEFNTGFVPPEVVGERFERVRAACRDAGRDPADLVYSVALEALVGRDDAELRRRADRVGVDPAERAANGLVGTPEQVVDRIGAYAEAGATRLYLQLWDLTDLDHLELVAAEVMPRLS